MIRGCWNSKHCLVISDSIFNTLTIRKDPQKWKRNKQFLSNIGPEDIIFLNHITIAEGKLNASA